MGGERGNCVKFVIFSVYILHSMWNVLTSSVLCYVIHIKGIRFFQCNVDFYFTE